MAEIKKKNGVEILEEGQHLKICVPSFSTMIIVYQEDKKDFIKYLKYIHDKYKLNKYSYRAKSVIQYGEDKIFLGESFSVKYLAKTILNNVRKTFDKIAPPAPYKIASITLFEDLSFKMLFMAFAKVNGELNGFFYGR